MELSFSFKTAIEDAEIRPKMDKKKSDTRYIVIFTGAIKKRLKLLSFLFNFNFMNSNDPIVDS